MTAYKKVKIFRFLTSMLSLTPLKNCIKLLRKKKFVTFKASINQKEWVWKFLSGFREHGGWFSRNSCALQVLSILAQQALSDTCFGETDWPIRKICTCSNWRISKTYELLFFVCSFAYYIKIRKKSEIVFVSNWRFKDSVENIKNVSMT